MQETQIRSLGQEDALEKEIATHSSILAWRIPWTEEPGGLVSRVAKSQYTTERLTLSFHFFFTLFYHFTHYFILFFLFIFISWRLITLQSCFCHTLTWISHGFTCVLHPDPPSRLPHFTFLTLKGGDIVCFTSICFWQIILVSVTTFSYISVYHITIRYGEALFGGFSP